MADYTDKVAIITGAASGIGYGIARKCARNNMNLVLADIDKASLEKARNELSGPLNACVSSLTDVTKQKDVQELSAKALNAFGRIDFLFINAGVNIKAFMCEYDILDWKWIIDVNLWGTIHCLRSFLPIMKNAEHESHIVITASAGAFMPFQTVGPYNATKAAILALAETLYNELRIEQSRANVHVICPGMVRTNISNAEARRQSEYMNPGITYKADARDKFRLPASAVEGGISADNVADEVFRSIEKNEFYIFPQPDIKAMIASKYEAILNRNMPLDLSGLRT
jgi:NADP-dependent 3-hydroxy acid dehydrogenase YdfG